ncbi:hypothetical protein NL108_001371 [Boleophthalmus pectinirostris]|uniref:urokinase plasminogen activator surface receptor-like n=1 Tax=Boleophthalmus pectinirostris TaxID=150288 RepID=UPI000A1C61EE|nr:urokinase plasminogen activator surface receptor-like [Boleophthalmus pectinirostris]KAJ0066139.1 hypothetical protein NL108_001371 [Boleophthalmus pectinirostris]
MYLFFLISGIVFIPQAYTLICNECSTFGSTCESTGSQCSEATRCATLRMLTYSGNTEEFDHMLGSCSKAEHCYEGSFNTGVKRNFFTTKCCDTDKCNREQPPLPNIKSNPNGKKCYRCDGVGECTGTVNCDGDQTYCATGQDGGETVKGCATKSMCFNPPPLLPAKLKTLKCCEGNYCNGSSGTTASLLLLTTMLLSLLLLSN